MSNLQSPSLLRQNLKLLQINNFQRKYLTRKQWFKVLRRITGPRNLTSYRKPLDTDLQSTRTITITHPRGAESHLSRSLIHVQDSEDKQEKGPNPYVLDQRNRRS